MYGLGGDAGTGNGVNVSRLSLQQSLLELLGCGLADIGRFVRDVKNNVRDLIGVKSHRDDDITNTGSLCRIGTRLVDAGGSGMNANGSQRCAAGDTRTQERTTRQDLLVHESILLG